jgi:neutral ceramidase
MPLAGKAPAFCLESTCSARKAPSMTPVIFSRSARHALKRCAAALLAMLSLLGSGGDCRRASAAPARTFRAGAATSNITPWLGVSISGGFQDVKARHVHDELHARCLVLDDGETRLAFAIVDVALLGRELIDEAKSRIREHTGIPPTHVLIAATHTHSAPTTIPLAQCEPDPAYQKFLVQRVADGVRRAANQLAPARIGWGTVDVPQHVFNRRWRMKPGSVPANPFGGTNDLVRTNPGVNNADLVEPAGPTDPQVWFVSVQSTNGQPVALLADYSLHYVGGVTPGDLSADYYGVFADRMTELLQAERGNPPFVAMLANGTSGDINNINFRKPRGKQEAYAQMRYVAEDVAAKVHAALAKVEYRDHVALAARYREPEIATRRPSAELLEWAKKTVAERPQAKGKTDLTRIYAERTFRMAEHPEKLKIPLQVLRIGDAVVGTMPCEIFCEIGLAFKKQSPLQPAWLVSIAHGYYGYLPTPRHHALGGYETWLGTNRLEVQASDKMLAELVALVGELK